MVLPITATHHRFIWCRVLSLGFILNSVFFNYSIPIKAKTAKDSKMVENLENQTPLPSFPFLGYLSKHTRTNTRTHAHRHIQLLEK